LSVQHTSDWSWADLFAQAGVKRDGRFNAGALPFEGEIVWIRNSGAVEVVTPAAFGDLVARLVSSLEHLGVKAGDRVAGFLGRRPEAFAGAVAAWRLGAIYVPLFTSFGTEAIATRLDDSGAAAAITDVANRAPLGTAEDGLGRSLDVIVVDGVLEGDAVLRDVPSTTCIETRIEDVATIVYTSGTTSRPKGCVMPHRALLNLWPYVDYALRLTTGDNMFSTADPGWSFGLLTTGLAPLARGYRRILVEAGFHAETWWQVIDRTKTSHLCTAPTGLRQLIAGEDGNARGASRTLGRITTAGEALTADIVSWFRDELGVPVHNSFGLSELGMLTASTSGTEVASDALAVALGTPLPGFSLRVVSEEGLPVADGEVGRLAVRDEGQFLSSTYWRRQSEWDDRRADDWWVTEDLVRRDEAGAYWYVDRRDDIIVTAGYNVSPGEVEAAILAHPRVAEVGCVGAPDSRKGLAVVAHVVLEEGEEPPDLLAQLRGMVGSTVGWHAAPRRIVVHNSLPRTESGKLRRRDLRESAASMSTEERSN
jgi:acetyl-CoA synthetase